MNLPKIALHFRTLHFYAQGAHHRAAGPTFFEDHEYLEKLYTAYADAFDLVCEFSIATRLSFDEQEINFHAAAAAQSHSRKDQGSIQTMFQTLLDLESALQKDLAACSRAAELPEQNLLATFAQDSRHRAHYKLAQRLRKIS